MATPSHTEAPTPAEPASDAVDSRDVSVLDQRAPLLVRLDGSSAVFPIAKAMAKEFEEAKKGAIKVIVDKSDTDGRRFARGETDISNDSQPISKWRMNACLEGGVEYIELPICFDVLTVAVNPKNDWVSSITVEELDKIWHEKLWEPDRQGKITRWNQVRPEWPAEDLVLFGAAPASAATDYFAEAICRILSRRNFIASESDSVLVHGIEGNKYAIGYIRYGYYEQRKDHIRALAIEWSENSVRTPVMPSIENVQKGIYKPLSRLLCLYVNRKSSERREVAEFIEFFLDHAANLTRELGYLPLPEQVYQNLKQRVAQQQCGTAFGGVAEVALTIDAMLRRSLVSVPAQQK
jgi:phosphate transport system substrate-binding protein